EAQWALCAGGHGGDDPAVLMGHAEALLELGRAGEALTRLEHLRGLGGPEAKAPRTALAFARAYEALGRNKEADEAYRFAADRVPGLEAGGRYVAFMAKTGRREDAEIGFAELERRLAKIAPPLPPEARLWRDLADKALGRASSIEPKDQEMDFKCGIVGLPNVGKSTLFNALTKTAAAQAANYPFCTIEPNV